MIAAATVAGLVVASSLTGGLGLAFLVFVGRVLETREDLYHLDYVPDITGC